MSPTTSWLPQLLLYVSFLDLTHCLTSFKTQISPSHWSLLCFFIEKLYIHPSVLSSAPPCIIFIQYLSLSNILLDLLTYYLLAVPSTKCKIHEVKFLCILSILYPQHLNQRRCLINSCWMNEWMNVWMHVFCLVIGWCNWSGRTLATTLCASFWIQLPFLIVWLYQLFWIEIFFFSPDHFLMGLTWLFIGQVPAQR